MKNETFYLECDCRTDEHTLRFTLDTDDPTEIQLFTSVFLNQYRGFFSRLWVSIKYLFGYKCKDGHWDCTLIKLADVDKLIHLLEVYKKLSEEVMEKNSCR